MSWIDRVVEFPSRVKLTAVSGQDNVYDIEPNEGNVYVEGTLLNASNLTGETVAIAQNEIETYQGDYVVERNSGNGYEWRKWASGNAEYWAYGSTTVVQYASWNGWASYQLPLNFVGNIFNTAPHICGAHIYIGSGFSCVSDTGTNTTATGTTFYVLGSATGTQPVKYNIYVKGTWK